MWSPLFLCSWSRMISVNLEALVEKTWREENAVWSTKKIFEILERLYEKMVEIKNAEAVLEELSEEVLSRAKFRLESLQIEARILRYDIQELSAAAGIRAS